MPVKFALLLYCAAALTPAVATAQKRTTELSPANPSAAVPAIKYESAFTGYLPFRDEKLAPWREVNDEAARVGGHLGIFGGAAGHGGPALRNPPFRHQPLPPSQPQQACHR